ncbi:kinase non-catalytic C-lobe domain-containing protein 1 isoform X2 [Pimephales promelas]|uniref:kinase non-catalytic C-lobe domain-containing protein 1 isoform X2 n=1 Tax=Pimephales promelas TaxID=90988 RepID=UPI001955F0DF|nr:kinase non-catalytic C-lobe domain-containing protein 1 isoform X2 [Pimephales promelas]KAG1963052.1 Ras guanine nucleotide exchange factor [Pimephales promelas]
MGTFGSAVVCLEEDEEEEEEKRREVERLPPLLEDEENVSLADILCLRDSGLSEQELWAVCVECVCSLQSISLSPLFHTLCVTPDTLAFNAHGNVCFMDQLSDDPDGCFVPPELDRTGHTFEGHMFSLGSTLWAALDRVTDPDQDLSEESRCLLEQMQREEPEDRPSLQDLLSQAEAFLADVSSTTVCRKLSAVGRRLLSIESVATFPDASSFRFLDCKALISNSTENHCSARPMMRNPSGDSCDGEELLMKRRGLVCHGSRWSGASAGLREDEPSADSRSQNSSPVRRRRALNRSCSVPDSNNPRVFSPPSHTPISMLVSDLSEISEDESWSGRLRAKHTRTEPCVPSVDVRPDARETDHRDAEADGDLCCSNHDYKTILSLNEGYQNQWMSLRDLLSRSAPLSVNELWALCHTCLSTLQTYIDLPDYLCLDSVFVGCEGEMLFLRPKNSVSCDAFFLAPEFQEHGIVTEKACVYGVAAVLWASAKFDLSPDQKLAMPRKLKRLLLEMAKRTPIERPSIETAKKCCRDYLCRQGSDAESVWTQLISRVHQALDGNRVTEEPCSPESAENTPDPLVGQVHTGFVPLALEGRLAPVTGPVPHNYPVSSTSIRLPEAFTSPDTHFSPIVLIPQSELIVSFDDITDETLPLEPEDPSESDAEDDGIEGVFSTADHVAGYSSSSSCKTLVSSPPPAITQTTNKETDKQPNYPTLPCDNGIYNNFLLQQDPHTGNLTLLPVQIAVLQPITGVHHFSTDPLNIQLPKPSVEPDAPLRNDRVSVCHRDDDNSVNISAPRCVNHTLPLSSSCWRCTCVKCVCDLIRGEFTFDGCLENGLGDLPMGEYIFSLKTLRFDTFCRAVREKFSGVLWEQKLLCDLHHLINLVSDDQPSSNAVNRAPVSLQSARRYFPSDLDHSAELGSSQPSHRAALEENQQNQIKRQLKYKLDELKCRETDRRESEETDTRGNTQEVTSHEVTSQDDSKEVSECVLSELMEAAGAGECVCVSKALEETGITPDGSEMDECECQISSSSSGWVLAVFGHACFGPDVLKYAQKLSRHTPSPTTQDRSQELHQQLIIESRNLKKTRTFYHKLIQQERKHSGSDTKVMLSKVKQQFDELRDKVEFLHTVKKYLQLLSVDQCGLPLSLLPSLAASGTAPLHLQDSEDPALMLFVCERLRANDCPLVTATPRGLMAYLYARNAHSEGFIHQFFYTYRYFCTPEELLQFLMDRFNSTQGANEDPSSDAAKVCQRTLDLLHFWIGQSLDFSSGSDLLHTLNTFLNSEVAPGDRRRESLLVMLQAMPRKRRVCGLSCDPSCDDDASISGSEDQQSVHSSCRRSSFQDVTRKVCEHQSRCSCIKGKTLQGFQWRVSRVVEPQKGVCKEKGFSIAAALPRPCYASLMRQMSNTSVRSEERLAFSQTQHTPTHIAQQLTLLEQEIFQDCHPVHFLNSRAHGVAENAHISRCVSLEDNSLFLRDVSGPEEPLHTLITHTHRVSNWVSAELVICDSVKAQAALLARFLAVGKFCYETRNFATAMQILSGLENVIVRQLPAWKQLSGKVCEVLEELRAVQVFLKSDNLCLMEGLKRGGRPTLPDAQIFALHIQQLEIGAFTMTSGSYKWPKLRNIARVVSQIHAFQEHLYSYAPDLELQAFLRERIARFSECDVPLLASHNDANFTQMASDRYTHRIQDTLRRVKASFQ